MCCRSWTPCRRKPPTLPKSCRPNLRSDFVRMFFWGDGEEWFWEPWVQKSLNKDQELFWSREIWCLSGSPGQQEQPRTETNIDFQERLPQSSLNTWNDVGNGFWIWAQHALWRGFVHQQGTAFWKLAFLEVRRFLSHPYLSNVIGIKRCMCHIIKDTCTSIFDCKSYHKTFHDSFAHCIIMVSNHFHPDAHKRCWRNKVSNHFSGQKPIHPGESEVGQGPTRGKGGLDWRWSTWNPAWCGGMMVTWNMERQACCIIFSGVFQSRWQACCIKTPRFSWKIGGVQGGVCFRPSCGFQSPTKTATRNSSTGGNGVFDTVYN